MPKKINSRQKGKRGELEWCKVCKAEGFEAFNLEAFSMSAQDVKSLVRNYQSYFKRINHPSKNTHYAMSKAVFFKYNLNAYQEEYFRKMETPNPMLLKRLDELMANFLFSWEDVRKNFKIIED